MNAGSKTIVPFLQNIQDEIGGKPIIETHTIRLTRNLN